METPIQIDFHGFDPTPAQQAAVHDLVTRFEDKFGRIVAGRIVVKGPGERHVRGGLYEINIRLKLPNGKEVDVSRTPPADERHSDFAFALNDAFKRARRQLQQQAERLQGEVKAHEGPATGQVTQLFDDHGFIEDEDGFEIYFHRNSVLNNGFSKLKLGTRVTLVVAEGENGPQASTVRPA